MVFFGGTASLSKKVLVLSLNYDRHCLKSVHLRPKQKRKLVYSLVTVFVRQFTDLVMVVSGLFHPV